MSRDKPKYYMYLVAYITVSPSKSMARLLMLLKEQAETEIVDYNEEYRRVVAKFTRKSLPWILMLIEDYASSATIEIKAVHRGVSFDAIKRLTIYRVSRDNLLFIRECSKHRELLLHGEQRKKLLLKVCRNIIMKDPTIFPPSACIFEKDSKIVDLVIKSSECLDEFFELVEG